jgi:hypothetical protein
MHVRMFNERPSCPSMCETEKGAVRAATSLVAAWVVPGQTLFCDLLRISRQTDGEVPMTQRMS